MIECDTPRSNLINCVGVKTCSGVRCGVRLRTICCEMSGVTELTEVSHTARSLSHLTIRQDRPGQDQQVELCTGLGNYQCGANPGASTTNYEHNQYNNTALSSAHSGTVTGGIDQVTLKQSLHRIHHCPLSSVSSLVSSPRTARPPHHH